MPEDNQQNYTWAERNPELATGVRSLAVGGSVAAISAIISDILETRRQREEARKRRNKGISENTVVLHIRKPKSESESEKAAQACDGACSAGQAKELTGGCCTSPRVEPAVEEREIVYQGQGNQPRSKDGKFSTLGKVAVNKSDQNLYSFGDLIRWLCPGSTSVDYSYGQTLGKGMQIAAVPVFGALGYYGVSALHKKLEANRLKKQIAAAQQEYIDLLGGKQVKSAEAFRRMFLFEDADMTKQAGRAGNWLADVAGGAESFLRDADAGAKTSLSTIIAAMLLTGGTSAWLTHKVLANKFDKKEEEEEPNKVTKVMFKEFSDKSDPGFTLPKLMFKSADSEYEITPEQFICTIQVFRDYIRGSEPMSKQAGLIPMVPSIGAGEALVNGISALADGAKTALGNFAANNVVDWNQALRDYANGAEPTVDRETAMRIMRDNPDAWFNILGQKDNAGLRAALVNRYLDESNSVLGGMASVPILGDIVKFLARGFMGTKWGNRIMARRALKETGMTDEQIANYTKNMVVDENGWHIPGGSEAASAANPARGKPKAQTATAAPGAAPAAPAPVAPGAAPAAPAPAAPGAAPAAPGAAPAAPGAAPAAAQTGPAVNPAANMP